MARRTTLRIAMEGTAAAVIGLGQLAIGIGIGSSVLLAQSNSGPVSNRAATQAVLSSRVPSHGDSSSSDERTANEPLNIAKISFLIHPTCWQAALGSDNKPRLSMLSAVDGYRGGTWYDEREFMEILAWEKQVNNKQREYIRKMGPDEVLIIFAIAEKGAMRDLEQFALEHLGRRCIIVHSEPPYGSDKVDYRQLLPANAKIQVIDDLLEAVHENGDAWSARALKIILHSRVRALIIEDELRKRALHFDPKTVEAVAFGEGFEECAMEWKSMVSDYLNLAKPIENDFELSVSGMSLLRSATFKERVALNDDVRLFLWELKDGRPMALFARARARLSDPQPFAVLPFDPKSVQVFADSGEMLWPHFVGFVQSSTRIGDVSVRAESNGPLDVPVFMGLRQLPSNRPSYIVVSGSSYSEFRQALVKAPIITKPIAHISQ